MAADQTRLERIFDLERRIRTTAEALERLKAGALVAFFGGAMVLGAVGHGVFWIPAAMSGALLSYRLIATCMAFGEIRRQNRLSLWDAVRERMEDLHQSELPAEQIRVLGRALENELPSAVVTDHLLPNPKASPETSISTKETKRAAIGSE